MPSVEFSPNRARPFSLLAYVCGIELPCSNFHVSTIAGDIPTASFSVAPDPVLKRLGAEDRVPVQLFYLDDVYSELDGKEHDFRLLFEGEIVGWNYVNSGVGRSMSFSCRGHLSVLDELYPFFIQGPNEAALGLLQSPTGNQVSSYQLKQTMPWSLFFFGPKLTNGESKEARRPFDILLNVLHTCIGKDAQSVLKSIPAGVFFARYMRKTNFLRRFVPSPLLEQLTGDEETTGIFPVWNAVQTDQAISTLLRQGRELGDGASLWQIVKYIYQNLYYEVSTILAPPIAQVDYRVDTDTYGEILGKPLWKSTAKQKLREEARKRAIAEATRIADQEMRRTYYQYESDAELERAKTEMRDSIASQLEDDYYQEGLDTYNSGVKPNCLINHVTKPLWLHGVPPACNVIFPSMLRELRYDENYLSQPTRLYIQDRWLVDTLQSGGKDETQRHLSTLVFGYPEQVQMELDKRTGWLPAKLRGNPTLSGKNMIVWPEEFFKGPVCTFTQLPNWYAYLNQQFETAVTPEEKQAIDAVKLIDQGAATGLSEEDILETLKAAGVVRDYISSVSQARELLVRRSFAAEARKRRVKKTVAHQEYVRMRSAARTGTAVTIFNPYIVAGYPTIIFDDLSSGQHIVAYVSAVRHTGNPGDAQTIVQFTHAQTLEEYIQEVFDARVGNTLYGVNENILAAPLNPVESLRDILQTFSGAEDYFSLLLHQKREYSGRKSAAFDFTKAIRFLSNTGDSIEFDDIFTTAVKQAQQREKDEELDRQNEIENLLTERRTALYQEVSEEDVTFATEEDKYAYIELILENERILYEEQAAVERLRESLTKPKQKIVSQRLNTYTTIAPSRKFADVFRDSYRAMQYVSRPVCTLDEYIQFRGRMGTRVNKVLANNPAQGRGAMFYEKIIEFTQGPGTTPTFNENNELVSPELTELADTRVDWASRIWNYRRKILYGRIGSRPDGE